MAPSTPPIINLVQLDQLGEILANATVPVGTYTSATVTLAANNNGAACDTLLVVSGDPSSGFPLPAGSTVPCSQIEIMGAQGNSPNVTVPLSINLVSPLTVTSGSSNALDLEFDLRHPAFIVEHQAATTTTPPGRSISTARCAITRARSHATSAAARLRPGYRVHQYLDHSRAVVLGSSCDHS